MKIYSNILKSIIDRISALILLIIFLPVLLILSILIYFNMGSPVFFIQERAGKNGEPFKLIKFRSMLSEEEAKSNKDMDRMTALGAFIRKFSLDELPQLINILKGEMSFIGPRPLHVRYNERYNNFQKQRLGLKPGITGYAQVMGRNSITWKEKFEFDVHYVNNISLLLDIKIAFLTVIKVLMAKDVNSEETTMKEFFGDS